MDTIDVELDVGVHTNESGPDSKYQNINLILNGVTVAEPFDCFTLIYSKLFKRCIMEITTCSCGNAGCAGVFYGSKIHRKARSVEVTRIDDRLPNRFYRFSKPDWDGAIDKTIAILYQVADLREKEGYDGYEGPDAYDGILGFNSKEEVDDRLKYGYDWHSRYVRDYEKDVQCANNYLNRNFYGKSK